jgi:hypothetical protein
MTNEEIIEIGEKAGMNPAIMTLYGNFKLLKNFAKLIAEKEREACAKVADEFAVSLERNYSEIIADKIRARGQE